MKSEDDRLARRKQRIEIHVAQSVWMLALRLQLHEIDDIDYADCQLRQMLVHDGNGGERFQRWHVAATGHHHVWASFMP